MSDGDKKDLDQEGLEDDEGNEGDILGDDDDFKDDSNMDDPELEAIKARVKEMEEEAEKIRQMQSEVEKQMNTSAASSTGSPANISIEEKMEIDNRSIYVGNVDYGATAEELEAHFHGCGSVNRVTILCDKFTGHPKGFAYVEFGDKDSVQTSLALDDSLFRGRQIKMLKNAKFREKSYWEDRFETEESYEWLADYSTIKQLVLPHLKSVEDRILVLGCGNSRLGFDLYDEGYTEITQVDYAKNVIDKMKMEHAGAYPRMHWLCCDVLDLTCIPDNSFNLVIEKATIDSLLVAEKDPWTLSRSGQCDMNSVLSGVSRILHASATFLSISFAQPHFRIPIYAHANFGWSLNLEKFGSHFHYFLYKMVKGELLNTKELEPYLYPILSSKPLPVNRAYDLDSEFDKDFLMNLDLW